MAATEKEILAWSVQCSAFGFLRRAEIFFSLEAAEKRYSEVKENSHYDEIKLLVYHEKDLVGGHHE